MPDKAALHEFLFGKQFPVGLICAGLIQPTEIRNMRVHLLVSREHRESAVRRDSFLCYGQRYDAAIRSVYKNVPAHRERNDLG